MAKRGKKANRIFKRAAKHISRDKNVRLIANKAAAKATKMIVASIANA